VTAKKSLHFFWGIILILLGAWVGFIAARATFTLIRNIELLSNPWLIGILLLRALLSAFCIWIGSREFQRATGQDVKEPRFRWGRMLAGTCLVFLSLRAQFSPSPTDLKAENADQALGMRFATIFMVLAGMFLVAYSFKPRKSQSQLESTSQSNSAQDATYRG